MNSSRGRWLQRAYSSRKIDKEEVAGWICQPNYQKYLAQMEFLLAHELSSELSSKYEGNPFQLEHLIFTGIELQI